MKKYLTILLLLSCIIGLSQERNYAVVSNGNFINFDGKLITATIDSSLIGLIASWSSTTEDHIDSLTFNSTGALITYVSGTTVVIDDSTEVVVGNAIRFTTPSSGTVYTITDTLGSRDTLVLDQSCTASVTDEFYTGCIGSINDASGNNNTALQTTGSKQPKVLWINADTIQIDYDGTNDNLDFGVITLLKNGATISLWYNNWNNNSLGSWFFGYNASGFKTVRKVTNIIVQIESNTNNDLWSSSTVDNDNYWHNLSFVANGGTITTYYDGVLVDTRTPANDISLQYIASYTTGGYWNGSIDDIKFYNRPLSITEISVMYQNSRFYTP